METEADLVNAFIRVISLSGRQVMETLFCGQFTLVKNGAGKLVSTNVGGKSFSFAVDAKQTTSSLLVLADKALRLWDSMDSTARASFLTARPIKTARAVFC